MVVDPPFLAACHLVIHVGVLQVLAMELLLAKPEVDEATTSVKGIEEDPSSVDVDVGHCTEKQWPNVGIPRIGVICHADCQTALAGE